VATTELKCELSWSASRRKEFERCRKEYHYGRYASWGWWKEGPDSERWKVAIHKNLTSLPAFAGNCVHDSIQHWFEMSRGGVRMTAAELYEECVHRFREGWRQSSAFDPRDRPKRGKVHLAEHHYGEELSKERTEEVRALLERCARAFVEGAACAPAREAHPDSWRALEELGHYRFLGVPVYAVPDFAYVDGDVLHVWDWKTGTPRGDDRFQLHTYALYACEKWSHDPEAIVLHAAYLSEGKVESWPVELGELSAAQDVVSESVRAMMEVHYDPLEDPFVPEHWPASPSASTCRTCRFRGICSDVHAAARPRLR